MASHFASNVNMPAKGSENDAVDRIDCESFAFPRYYTSPEVNGKMIAVTSTSPLCGWVETLCRGSILGGLWKQDILGDSEVIRTSMAHAVRTVPI